MRGARNIFPQRHQARDQLGFVCCLTPMAYSPEIFQLVAGALKVAGGAQLFLCSFLRPTSRGFLIFEYIFESKKKKKIIKKEREKASTANDAVNIITVTNNTTNNNTKANNNNHIREKCHNNNYPFEHLASITMKREKDLRKNVVLI